MSKEAYDVVLAARSQNKISTKKLISMLFNNFIELHGDRLGYDDAAIIGGLAKLNDITVMVIGIKKGSNSEENIDCHFGMVTPAGYHKAMRLLKQAEKFKQPVITIVNTPGAYPGEQAEYDGQGYAIAQCIEHGMALKVPYLSIITGEGGSGGALALATGNQVWMSEDSVYSILSPEGYAAILYKDAKKAPQAAEKMGLTPLELLNHKIVDQIIPEIKDDSTAKKVQKLMYQEITKLNQLSENQIIDQRYDRFNQF